MPHNGQEPAIELRNVSKAYRVNNGRRNPITEAMFGPKNAIYKTVLDDISLTIHRGEVVGIIGRNGAGKSTLLKLIAGTLQPTSGQVNSAGRVAAILELGTGFNPAYSGRDNVILASMIRGLSEKETQARLNDIIAFSGLEDVIDEPFHTYSSGMQARLAFAAAISVDADTVIIDEALAAGDARFTARSLRRVRDLCRSGITALFVSHQTYHVLQMCTRAIWIDGGRVRMDGPPIDVCRAYEYEVHAAIARDEGRSVVEVAPMAPPPPPPSESFSSGDVAGTAVSDPEGRGAPVSPSPEHAVPEPPESDAPVSAKIQRASVTAIPDSAADQMKHFGTGDYRITSIEMLNSANQATTTFRFGEPFRLRVSYECMLATPPEYSCGVAAAFTSEDMQHVMYFNTNYPHSDAEIAEYDTAPFRQYKGQCGTIEATIPYLQVKPGDYLVSVGILPNAPRPHEFYEFHYLAYKIRVAENGYPEPSVFYPIVQWAHGPREA